MITPMTFVFAIVAIGGALFGGWLAGARLPAVALAAASAFLVMCLLELAGIDGELPLTAAYLTVAAAVGFLMKLSVKQVVAVLACSFLASFLFHVLLGFIEAFSGQMNA